MSTANNDSKATTPPSPPTSVNLSVDGVPVTVPPGTLIIQAAKKAGTFVPHFCYHEGLSVVGQCRMCFVEIEGAPKLATSCSTTVAEGMKVLTQSEKVKAGQNGTLEFTLLNHPLDCPICDRGGECKLQDYTYEYGPPLSRMIDEKSSLLKHTAVSEQVVLDQERCILCTRCVRFSSEVDGKNELVVNERGHWSKINTFENRPMTSNFSGNVVDLCPVGALTAKDFRFKARPWELKKHQGLCTGCAVGCNVEIHTKHRDPKIPRPGDTMPGAKIERLIPRENPQVNTWWMCDKGRWGYHFHNNLKRITEPLIRRNAGASLSPSSLREVQALIETHTGGAWEFWIDDNQAHEGIAWAKELAKSWSDRGRKLSLFNQSAFATEWMQVWKSRLSSPWSAGQADWSSITKVIATSSYRDLEQTAPILALRLGQAVRKGKIKWEVMSVSEMAKASSDLNSTAFLVPVPKTSDALKQFAALPAQAKTLILWTHSNSRGLLNEGIVPLEALEESLKGQSPKGPVFFFSQHTQNDLPASMLAYATKASFLLIADSFMGSLAEKAHVVLPLNPLYESPITMTNLEGIRQFAGGIHVDHPNHNIQPRGSNLVSPALKLL